MANNAFELAVELVLSGTPCDELVAAFDAAVLAQGFRYCPLAWEMILGESCGASTVESVEISASPAPAATEVAAPSSIFAPGDVPLEPLSDEFFNPLEEGGF